MSLGPKPGSNLTWQRLLIEVIFPSFSTSSVCKIQGVQMASNIQLPSEKDQNLQGFRNYNRSLADQDQEQFS